MHLAKTIFPLSDYKKDKVRELANIYNLPSKSAKESQDICFIKPPMTTKKYLNNILTAQKGNFVEKSTGRILGKHEGFWQYTIGQRKGIGLAAPEPLYVLEIDALTNTVYVGYKNELYRPLLILKSVTWSYPFSQTKFDGMVKIRYNMKAVKANIIIDNGGTTVNFYEPVSGITPGQACVIYSLEDGHLLGGGFI